MDKRIRSYLINATVLIIAFIVMIAALGFNTGSTGQTTITFSGTVTDGEGEPICGAEVDWWTYSFDFNGTCVTNETGAYSFDVPLLACYEGIVAASAKSGHWTQVVDVEYISGIDRLTFDFTLVSGSVAYAACCPVVLATINDGSTEVEKATHHYNAGDLVLTMNCQEIPCFFTYSVDNSRSYSETTVGSTYSFATLEYLLMGQYNETPSVNYKYGSLMASTGSSDADRSDIVVRSLDGDYISPESVADRSVFYTVGYGDNITVTVEQLNETTFPDELTLPSMLKVLDGQCDITLKNVFQGSCEGYVYASVTLTPLTEGTHVYQVYIEDELVIHIWEIN